jgi:hypothetical protein
MSDYEPKSIDHNMSSPPGHTLPDSTPVYALLHFDLEDPEGERRLRECLDAPKVLGAVHAYAEWLRSKIRYSGDDDADPKLTAAWNNLFQAFSDHDVNVPGWG